MYSFKLYVNMIHGTMIRRYLTRSVAISLSYALFCNSILVKIFEKRRSFNKLMCTYVHTYK